MLDKKGNMDDNISTLEPPQAPKLIQGAAVASMSLPGIVANVFAIAVTVRILRIKAHRLSPNVFVLGLTCVDLFAVVGISVPSLLYYAAGKWIGGKTMCNFQGFVALFCSLASGGIALAMAVERLLSVTWPIRYREKKSPSRAKNVVIAIVTGTAAISLMPVCGIGGFVKSLSGSFCTFDWFAKDIEDAVYSYVIIIYGVVIVLTLLFCNVIVIVKLYQQTKKRKRLSVSTGTMNSLSGKSLEWQFGRMMVVISCVFLLCWIPFMVRMICNMTKIWLSEDADLQSSRLALLNFVLDPFTYVLTRTQYRQALRDMCCVIKGQRITNVLLMNSRRTTRTSSLLQEKQDAAVIKTKDSETKKSLQNSRETNKVKDQNSMSTEEKANNFIEMTTLSRRKNLTANGTLIFENNAKKINNTDLNIDSSVALNPGVLKNSNANICDNNCFINMAYSRD